MRIVVPFPGHTRLSYVNVSPYTLLSADPAYIVQLYTLFRDGILWVHLLNTLPQFLMDNILRYFAAIVRDLHKHLLDYELSRRLRYGHQRRLYGYSWIPRCWTHPLTWNGLLNQRMGNSSHMTLRQLLIAFAASYLDSF